MSLAKLVNCLRNISGSNAKINFITDHKHDLKLLLQYTYDPFKKYNIAKLPWEGTGTYTLEDIYWPEILDNILASKIRGQALKDILKTAITSLSPADAEVFKAILKKDLKCNISVSTINKAILGLIPTFGCMLAKPWNNVIPASGLFASIKYDGLRAVYLNQKLYTRNGHEITGVDHVLYALRNFPSCDGEIFIPNEHFQVSSGKLRSFENCPDATYYIFDLPASGLAFSERLSELRNLQLAYTDDISSPLRFVKHVLVDSINDIDRNFGKVISAGYEGLVLKTPGHIYQQKRSSDWMKLKATNSVDCPVIGFFPGQGKYDGILGGIVVDHDGTVVKVGSGFSDEQRKLIWFNQKDYLGLTAEVLYHEVTPDGSLRHPRLKCFRIDK